MPFFLRSVNWRDGMVLTESFLREERFSLEERFRWLLRHGITGFGLVPSRPGSADPLLLEGQTSDGSLTIHLNRCLAVTPDGSLIHIDSTIEEEAGGTPPVTTTVRLGDSNRTLHVCVEVPAGEFREHGPISEGEPARPRWRHGAYELRVLEEAPQGAQNVLELARYQVDGGDAARLESFIPPCLTVGSHPALREKSQDLAGHFRACWDASVLAVQKLTQERQERGQAALGAVPAERFAQALASLSADGFSAILDPGAELSPAELIGAGRRFLRAVQALIESHPELRSGTWESYLSSAGHRAIQDHLGFRRELESRLGEPVVWHPIHEGLLPLIKLVELVSNYPHALVGGEGPAVPADSHDTYIYQGKTYHRVPYQQVNYVVRQEYHYLDLEGLRPKAGGRFLIWLRCSDDEQRRLARTLKCGGPNKRAYLFMKQQVPDVESDDRAILLVMDLEAGETLDTIHVACRRTDTDLNRMNTDVPDEDIVVYHKA